ncbi:VOC family protein [Ilumatobacter sp.]|uniref:VOC family protein n=1 Tax=Ilumatobacter sp. TaxID=1967498 RepID=UPI003AF627BE
MAEDSAPPISGFSHVDLSVTDLDASAAWYQELLGMVPLFGGRNDERGYDVKYLMEPNSGVVIGLEQHDANPGTAFDERRVGLDHLSFGVADRLTLDTWLRRLDEQAVPHSGITEEDLWDVLVLRDPDNIQLEFIYVKPEALAMIQSPSG